METLLKKPLTSLLLTAIALGLTSCASFAGLGGKAHYVQKFEDTEGGTIDGNGVAVPGQKTMYSLDIKGPAGMKWEEITSMSYRWSATEGEIGVNSQSKADTLATAEAIKAVVPALADSITSAVTAGVLKGIEVAAPLISQKIEADRATRSQQIEARRSTTERVIDRAPVPPVTENPLVPVVEGTDPPVAPPLSTPDN